MSYTELKVVKPSGDVEPFRRFGNSHGFAPAIWRPICERCLGSSYAWLTEPEKLWKLTDDHSVPRHWRMALMTTFDRYIIEASKYGQAILDLFKFYHDIAHIGEVNHLPNIGYAIKEIDDAGGNTLGVCFSNSLSTDLWVVGDGETIPSRPYNLNTDVGHRFLYEQLK